MFQSVHYIVDTRLPLWLSLIDNPRVSISQTIFDGQGLFCSFNFTDNPSLSCSRHNNVADEHDDLRVMRLALFTVLLESIGLQQINIEE